MKTRTYLMSGLFVAALVLPASLFAGGGGGVEFMTNLGTETLPSLTLPAGKWLDVPTGSVVGVSGFGYGITRGGGKIGGFGMAIFAPGVSLSIPEDYMTIHTAGGGIGGLISGGAARIGPFDLSVNLRLGIGGIGVGYLWSDPNLRYGPREVSAGTIAFYGSADVELGLIYVPAMMISVYAGASALAVPFPIFNGSPIVPSITGGLRITWGSF